MFSNVIRSRLGGIKSKMPNGPKYENFPNLEVWVETVTVFIKVHTATRWTIRHSLKLHWFADLMNVTEEVTIHRPNVSTLLSSTFIRGDLNAATRGPFYMITN